MKRSTESYRAVPDLTSDSALDLYAKVEDLLGVKDAAPDLYAFYFEFLETVDFDSLLDIGCGSGDFLLQIQDKFAPESLAGIDLSPLMVEQARQKGLDVRHIDLCSLDRSFGVITAVFDMLNYLNRRELRKFLQCVEDRIMEGCYFLCDINTLYGFEEVAVGSFIVDDDDRFLTIDSDFDGDTYESEFTLFKREGEKCFRKSNEIIRQYYHTADEIDRLLPDMTLLKEESVTLYGDEPDKHFLVFQKGLSKK